MEHNEAAYDKEDKNAEAAKLETQILIDGSRPRMESDILDSMIKDYQGRCKSPSDLKAGDLSER
jgi:hypothetical protein